MAWHFVGDSLRDGRPVPADGVTLRHDGPLVLCELGLHASKRLIDALQYAPGSTICRVQCEAGYVTYLSGERVWQEIVVGDDKLVAPHRTILWRVDGETLLRDFARRCALDVIDLWDAPDVMREYLTTGDEMLRDAAGDVAWDAARDAARAAAWDAAWAAARAAARAAAWDAAWAAARAAAWAAAWDAAWAAARAAAWDAARDATRAAACDGARAAAWDAARDTARDGAWDTQNRRLTAMVSAAHRRTP